MANGDLTTLANAKQYLNVASTGDDALLTRLISAASQFVQTWMNRRIASADYSEKYTGSGSDTLAIANYPITAVSSLMIHNQPIPASVDGVQHGFVFDERFIYLVGQTLLSGFGRYGRFPERPPLLVAVQYTAGYDTTPLDIEQAVLELIALKYSDRAHFGQSSKNLGDGQVVSYVITDMTPGVKTLLTNYRKVIPV